MINKKHAKQVLPSGYDPALDGFRGLAVLFVVWSHATDLDIPKNTIFNLEGTGRYGVYLFFVLSAFLLSRQILTCSTEKLKSVRYWANYLLRRFLRIYPAFSLALVLYVLFHNWHPDKFPSTWPVAWDVITLQKKASVFWTIAVEFKYYLLLPVTVLLFRSVLGSTRNTIILFCILCLGLSILFPPEYGIRLWSYIPIFLCGTFTAVLSISIKAGRYKRLSETKLNRMGLFGLFFVLFMFPAVWRKWDPGSDLDEFHLWYLPFGIAWSMVMLSGVNGRGIIRSIACFRPLRLLGRISFSMYLIHMLILGWINVLTESLFYRLVIYISAIVLISTISWYSIEKPLSRIRIKT